MAKHTPGVGQSGLWQWLNYPDGRKLLTGGNRAVIHCPGPGPEISVLPKDQALIAAAPFAHKILDEIREALEQTNGRETSQVTRIELAPALARIRQYFQQVEGQP